MTQPGMRLPCRSRGFAKETSGCLTFSQRETRKKKNLFDRTIPTQSSFLHMYLLSLLDYTISSQLVTLVTISLTILYLLYQLGRSPAREDVTLQLVLDRK